MPTPIATASACAALAATNAFAQQLPTTGTVQSPLGPLEIKMLAMLVPLGIVKGRPFDPDARAREILDRAAKTACKMSRVVGFEEVVGGRSFRVYPDRRRVNPLADLTPSNPTPALDLSRKNIVLNSEKVTI
jgi:hypothetical protein